MSKHQVFLIHGMGSFEQHWSLDIQKQLRDIFASYKKVAGKNLIDHYEFVEITYNDVFEAWRQQWKDDAQSASIAATKLGLDTGVAQKLLTLAKASGGDSFFQTHVLDVIMFRYLTPVAEEVCQSVRKQILGRLNAFPQNDRPQWSVIAHSLGTSVIHDTLQAMFSQPVDGVLLGDTYRPYYIFMIANVSNLLWNREGNFYASDVRPHVVDSLGMCWKYGNFKHELDPISQVDPFSPPRDWFPADLPKSRVYIDIKIDKADIQDLNVHDLSHYLSHPNVHIPIIKTLLDWPEIISAPEEKSALSKWRSLSLQNAALTAAQNKLKGWLVSDPTLWPKIVQMMNDYRGTVINKGIDPK